MAVNTEEKQDTILTERNLQILAELRLMDDEFFSEALDGKTEAVEYILNTILGRTDLKVKHTASQVEYKSAVRRSIKLDIQAVDEEGEILDIEIQRSDHGAGARRARFHSSMIDRTLLEKGDEFEDLVDTYVIFITENDKFKVGMPLYHVERTVEELGNLRFDDGAHIIYVNGSFCDVSHPVGRLMHDFHCKEAENMLNPVLAEEVRTLKETEGGQRYMCKLLEEMRKEAAAEAEARAVAEAEIKVAKAEAQAAMAAHDKAVGTAVKLLERARDTCEEIAEITGLSLEEVQELAQK